MATILDETAILRYLLKDNVHQAQRVAEIITRVCVVLRDVYRVPRSVIARVLDWLLDDVNAPEKPEIRLAVRYFGSTTMDFTDCMMLARNVRSGHAILSFDKGVLKRALM